MNNTTSLIIIGGSGLLGSRINELLSASLNIKNLSRADGLDITSPESLKIIEKDKDYSNILLLAAKTDVDGCEKDKQLGKEGDAWKINVAGVRNVAEVCRQTNKKLIYVSTDFVFDGKNTPEEGYTEDDLPNPINWYATTKYEGENAVIKSGARYIISRTSYPYRKSAEKLDFVRAIGKKLLEGKEILAVSDHIMTPTFIDDFAYAIDKLIHKGAEGIFHISGAESLSPFQAAIEIGKKVGANLHLVRKTTRKEFFKDRAERPFNLSMKSAKILESGIEMRSFREGLKEIF